MSVDCDQLQVHINQPHTIEEVTALERRAQRLRADYAREGKLVYDRLDRWQDEHRSCARPRITNHASRG